MNTTNTKWLVNMEDRKAFFTEVDVGTLKQAIGSDVDEPIENSTGGDKSDNLEENSIGNQQDTNQENHENNLIVLNAGILTPNVESKPELFVDNTAREVVVSKKKNNGYTCLICSRKFSQNAGRYNHMRNVHGIHPGEKTNVRCLEKKCNFTCSYREKLQLHLTDFHGIDMVVTMKSFESVQEFFRWKDEFERREKSRFVKKSGSRIREEGIRVAYYYCSRSGSFVSHGTGLKNRKRKGTSKTNHHCTASITCVEMPDGKIEVKMCSTHYGHDKDIQHLRLTQTEKFQIAEQLCKGVPRDLILDNVRSSAGSELDRIHLITMKDVKNIEKAFGIQATTTKRTNNMFYNLTVWISSIMETEHCPVLYFQEDGVYNNKNYCVTLVLLTTGQEEVLNRHCKNGIYYVTRSDFTSKQHHRNYPYRLSIYLTSVILIDDLNEAIPVSFMISNRGDTDRFTLFFQSLKQKVPGMSARAVITDDKKEIYEAWRDVFEEEPYHLWSNRFVDSEWRENLISVSDEELQVAIYEKLYSFLESQDPTKLETSLESYIYELQSNEITYSFGSYFASRFIGTEMLWAGCYGKKIVSISAQLNMENLYNEIQETSQKRNWDKNFIVSIIQNLLKLVRDAQCVRQTRLHRQIVEITTHHELAVNVRPETISPESECCWRINSVKDPVNIYSKVTKLTGNCDPTSCVLYCSKCNICVHQFSCTCRVHAYDKTMCKHIHAIALRFFPQVEELVNETSKGLPSAAPDIISNEVPSATEGNSENFQLESSLTEELVSVSTSSNMCRNKNKKIKLQETTNEDNLLPVLEQVIRNKRSIKTRPSEKKIKGRPRKSDKRRKAIDKNKIKFSRKKPRGRRTNRSSEDETKANENTSSYSDRLRPHRINILRRFKKKSS